MISLTTLMERIWTDKPPEQKPWPLRIAEAAIFVIPAIRAIPPQSAFFLYSFIAAMGLCLAGEPLIVAALTPVCLVFGSYTISYGVRAIPVTYDSVLYDFDRHLGILPSFLVGGWFDRFPWLLMISAISYEAVPLVLGLVATDKKVAKLLFQRIMVGLVLVVPLYFILPACGPAYLLAGKLSTAPRNAMPSMHLSWVILIYLASYQWSKGVRWLCRILVVLTVLATLGSGEHYLIDLVVAVPFTYAIHFSTPNLNRVVVFSGATLTLVWVSGLRFWPQFFLHHAVAAWLMAAVTVAAFVFLAPRQE